MKQDVNHRTAFAKPDTLSSDFGLIFEAIADAFRGISSSSKIESRWSRLRSCNDNC
jgi:hypothetical protein